MRSLFDSQLRGVPGSTSPSKERKEIKVKSSTGHKKKVLVMDDDPFIRRVIRSLFRDSGYDMRAVKNGVEAIENFKKAKALGNPFDAVILDLHVPPGMGGDETLKKLRDVDPEVKAILLTADICHPAVSDYETLGFKSAIIKPFSLSDLRQALDRAFGTMSDDPGESS
jgi:CheY-like chemotaxis protein